MDCCAEYEQAAGLSRRRFLPGMAAATSAAVATTIFGDAFRQTAFGAEAGGNVLVVLSACAAASTASAWSSRTATRRTTRPGPRIAVPKASLVAADSMFGLHPQMAPLKWLWDSGELAAVHAVGLPVPNRSHFSAMEEVEDADPGSSARRGWVNRMIGQDGDRRPVRGGPARAPRSCPPSSTGPRPRWPPAGSSDISLVGADANVWGQRRRTELDRMWAGASTPALAGAYRSATRTVDLLAPTAAADYAPTGGVTYPHAWPAATCRTRCRTPPS